LEKKYKLINRAKSTIIVIGKLLNIKIFIPIKILELNSLAIRRIFLSECIKQKYKVKATITLNKLKIIRVKKISKIITRTSI
jgi:hypothetical protein